MANPASEKNIASYLKGVFEKKYDRESWIEVLRKVFNANNILSTPHDTGIENKDWGAKVFELGNFETAEGFLVGIYEVPINSKIKLERHKVGLRQLLKSIYKNEVDAAFIVFDQESKWRFSYVSEIRVKDKETGKRVKKVTDPKRYTYMLGEGERCKTASEMFAKIEHTEDLFGKGVPLKSIEDAFNVDKVSKAFFDGYRDLYGKFTAYLTGKNENNREVGEPHAFLRSCFNGNEKEARNFIKKTLGRIVFLYFLEKKGWLGVPEDGAWGDGDENFVSNLYRDCKHKETFYSQVLVPLFFNTLNKERKEDLFDIDEDTFNTGDYHKQKIPFLNGGLFEEEENKKTNTLVFEPKLFSELFTFFDQYNFTVYEDSPEEHTVAVDPEMLGHIFENLLEDNKDKGAFYTPKEIVHYMCQQSITEYLYTKLNAGAANEAVSKEAIEKFIKNKELADIIEYDEAVLTALREVKICDPAIGSGAFPMGLLHEIFFAVELLSEVNPDTTHRVWKLKKWKPAKVKLSIIENSIYGVDIEPGAVDIARLRFWLSLVVDEDKPQPLPNLDYKIVVGNSLLPVLKIDGQEEVIDIDWNVNTKKIDRTKSVILEQEIKLASLPVKQHNYFIYKGDKHKLQNEIRNLKIEILINQLRLNKIVYEENNTVSLTLHATGKESEKQLRYKLKLEGYEQVIKKLGHIKQDKNKPLQFFDWMLDFSEVLGKFRDTENRGFDIVIGNPPYVQLQKMGEEATKLQNANYETFVRTGDIYSLFYEKGMKLLNSKGALCYITSNKWMRTNYGISTRKYFAEETHPLLLIDFGNVQVFESATVDTNILILKSKPNARKHEVVPLFAVRLNKDFDINSTDITEYVKHNGYELPSVDSHSWVVGEKDTFNIKGTVEEQGISLDKWDVRINYGIKTGLNDAFIIPEDVKNKLIAEDPGCEELFSPMLRGKDIKAWQPEFAQQWLIATHNGVKSNNDFLERVDINNYPSVRRWLDTKEPKLSKRLDKGDSPYNLRNCAYWKDFEKPKIIYPNMTKYLPFIYDETDHYYSNDKSFILVGEHLKYLVCFFNSKLFKYCFIDNFPELQGGTRELRKVFFDKIPVKIPTIDEEQPFNIMVDYLVALKKQKSDEGTDRDMFNFFEQVVDALVYELYFKSEFKENNLSVAEHVSKMKSLNDTEPVIKQLRQAYVMLKKQGEPVSKALFNMLSIPQIEVINNTSL